MKKITLDLRGMEGRKELHEYLKQELELPDYYGKNLDALYDCLTDINEDLCIGLIRPIEEEEDSRYLRSVVHVFKDAEKENEHICVFAWKA